MVEVEVANRSAAVVDAPGVIALAREVLEGEGVTAGEVGIAFVGADEIRELKRDHLGIDAGEPRALGDVVLCPDVVGDDWRWPLVHGLLHLMGHEHGTAMEARERLYAP
jgi:ssRNA-specific RNase YbeY (16S rRNA maturation enzyme)